MTRQRAPGWWYPWIFVGGMLVVIVVNIGLAVFAVSTFTGIQTEDHYRKGLAYNQALEAARAQDERGWTMDLTVSAEDARAGPRRAEVAATFVDRGGQPLEDLTVEASLLRPTHEGHDLVATLAHRGAGRYVAVVTVPLPGQWDARVQATRGGETFLEKRRVFLPR